MKPDLDTALHLLHSLSSGMLATHSTQIPGYPFASALPFMPDERHCPVFLLSSLAEHTKNLLADQRAAFLVTETEEKHLLENPRMTVVGDVTRIETSNELRARYLRYQPEAEEYLALGDFAFYRLMPKKVRYIGGFAQMGWLEDSTWNAAVVLPLADEAALIQDLLADLPPGVRLLGLDYHGMDFERKGNRERQRFPGKLQSKEQVAATVRRLMAAI